MEKSRPRPARSAGHESDVSTAAHDDGGRTVTLRQGLGADVQRIYEQIDDLLDSEDAIIILADGHRAIHYARGFGLSGCHHELLGVQIERAIRGVTGAESVDVGQPVVEREESSQAA